MKKAKLTAAIKFVLFLMVGLGIIYYLFHSYYTPSFLKDLKNVNVTWLFVSMLCAIVANVFRTLRWQLMIEPLINRKTSFINVFNALMVGYLVNLALPRAGELARCAWLTKKEQINTAQLVGSVIAERIFDLLILLVLVLSSAVLYRNLFLNLIDFDLSTLFKGKLFLVYIIIIMLLGALLLFYILSKKNQPFAIRVKNIFIKLWDGFVSVKKVRNRFGFIALTLGIWLFYIASAYFAFKMLPQTIFLSFSDALLCVVAGSFGMIAPIQGGIGAFHFMVTKCLMLLGVADTPALVYSTVLHASQTLMVVLFGLLAFLPSFNFLKRK